MCERELIKRPFDYFPANKMGQNELNVKSETEIAKNSTSN